MVVVPKSTIELKDHVEPIATSILALARAYLLESRSLVEANQSFSAKKRDPLRHA